MDFDLVSHHKLPRSARSVIFTGRQVDGDAKHHFLVEDYLPYFGVPHDERHRHTNNYNVVRVGEGHDIYQNKIGIIYVKRSGDVTILRDEYSCTYEAKILFHERVRIDKGIKSGFTVPDQHIRGKCFSCEGRLYHKISHLNIQGW